ncbi:MAG: amino acid ABC transporter permease [Deltaproteobacteria bacterium]|nr:amino acid ABC transporter permease [Deltaproteobacteria bacterium]MBW2670566.1 amino acid ABC transporter permease [Deltaproteobacteria bacterium]MBW2711289.1 amino acid ABC transporter permease [Deltaproteobacteria bacterium]
MGSRSLLNRLKDRNYYYVWVGVFFLLLISIVLSLYFSALQIDYTWRWYRIPQYFVYQDQVETKSEIDGEIQSILKKGEDAVVRVKGLEGTESYVVPASTLQVEEGDQIYYGDTLASYKKWRVGILMQGLWLTLKVSIIAIIFGIFIGLFTGLARISSNPALKWSAITYIEMIRGSPLLVQIFIWYFVLGTLLNNLLANQGIPQIPPLWFGVAALACFTGAYVAEMVRAGIQSIHRGQTEAARSLGMTYFKSMQHIILPQALRRILPPLAGQFISLIKDSSLLGIIAIRELTKATREVVTTSLQPFELWFVCALLYLVLTFSLSMLLQYLERRQLVV